MNYVEIEEEIGVKIEVGASNSRKRPGIFAIHWPIGGCNSRRDLEVNQARRMVAIREAKRALIKQGKPELTWDRWPLKVKAEYTEIRRRAPQIRNDKWRAPFESQKRS